MNDPPYLTLPEGKICDFIDGKFRNDTPEEYARQNLEKRLVNELKYPRERVGVEITLQLGSNKPRADVVIYLEKLPQVQENIHVIVECKKENVSPSDKKDGIEQLKSYMSACLNCEWGLWTNGRQRQVWRRLKNAIGQAEFIEFNDIPDVSGSTEDIDRPKRNKLVRADGDNLFLAFRRSHEAIHVNDGFNEENAFFEFLKIIFCKIEEERNIPKPLEFYVASNERISIDGQIACKQRIEAIFKRVKSKFNQIFDSNEEIKLSPRSLAQIVAGLQGYSFLSTDIDLKGHAYEEIAGSNLKGDRGQFFTPRNVMHMAVAMLNPKLDEKILDPACGTGGFLVTAMNHVVAQLKKDWAKDLGKPENEWNDDEKKALQNRISEMAESSFFGFDIAPELVKATKMNMVMNNDGSGNILRTDSLLPPHLWEVGFKESLAKPLKINPVELSNKDSIGFFDVIITNPPFGSKILIKEECMLDQYAIGHGWESPKKQKTANGKRKPFCLLHLLNSFLLNAAYNFLNPADVWQLSCQTRFLAHRGWGIFGNGC
ncbi:MAG: type I restriction enzyme HsdR N-terminal domain-containing protein [Methylobacter sp.]|nr:type I restriction enzyme HsdR N-terminal domain-containing protein [Methylobacter sp.]